MSIMPTKDQRIEELEAQVQRSIDYMSGLEVKLADMDAFIIKQAEELKKALVLLADWQRHGVKVTEDCETCGGSGTMPWHGDPSYVVHCPNPDCGGTGKQPRDGVTTFGISAWRCNNCGEDCRAEAGCDNPSYDDKTLLAFPAEWLGAE